MPATATGALLVAIDSLLARLFARPGMRGRFARMTVLEGQVLNKPSWQRRVHFKTAAGDVPHARFVIKSALETVALPGPLEDMRITLKELVGETGRQESLFQDLRRREQMREVIAQLKATQGYNPIHQVRGMEPWSRIPERRQALVPYDL